MIPGFRRLTLEFPYGFVHRGNEVYWYVWSDEEQGWNRMRAEDVARLTELLERLNVVTAPIFLSE